jgi:hypothetical protein
MDHLDKVVVFRRDDGGVGLLFPAPECTLSLQEIIDKDLPKRTLYQVVNSSDIPSDYTYFDAWIYEEN